MKLEFVEQKKRRYGHCPKKDEWNEIQGKELNKCI